MSEKDNSGAKRDFPGVSTVTNSLPFTSPIKFAISACKKEHISKEVSKEAGKRKREIANKKVPDSKEGKRRKITT